MTALKSLHLFNALIIPIFRDCEYNHIPFFLLLDIRHVLCNEFKISRWLIFIPSCITTAFSICVDRCKTYIYLGSCYTFLHFEGCMSYRSYHLKTGELIACFGMVLLYTSFMIHNTLVKLYVSPIRRDASSSACVPFSVNTFWNIYASHL